MLKNKTYKYIRDKILLTTILMSSLNYVTYLWLYRWDTRISMPDTYVPDYFTSSNLLFSIWWAIFVVIYANAFYYTFRDWVNKHIFREDDDE